MVPYHRAPVGATLLALLFAGGTAFVLFEDVRHGAEFTPSHMLTILALVATIAAGVTIKTEWHARRFLSAVGFALLFAAGTFYVVAVSGARNGETAAAKTARIETGNGERARLEQDLAENQKMLAAERVKMAADCATGDGKGCKGKRVSVQVYENAVAGVEAKLAKLEPAVTPNAGYVHTGRVLAAIPGVTATAEELAERLVLLIPFLAVLITELGTILFAHKAHAGLTAWWRQPSAKDRAQTDFGGIDVTPPAPVDPSPKKRRQSEERQAKVTAFVDGYRARHGRDPEPRDVRAATGLPRSTAHRYQRNVA
jgi:hypothetical protein